MALAVGERIDFFSSPDLRHWQRTGQYPNDLPGSGVWECPDLVLLPGARGLEWHLTYSVQHGGPFGHGATMHVPGHFDGHRLEGPAEPRPVDWGPDFYAMQSFHSAPDEAAVAMAWMSSWEYDDERSGDFAPLRFVPEHKTVVLGLVTSKFPELEDISDLTSRIDDAAVYVSLDQLCLSPQCGFSSTVHGNVMTEEQQWAKLRHVVEVAEDIWR